MRPEQVRVGDAAARDGDAALPAEVVLLELRGDDAFATLRAGAHSLVAKVPAESALRPGDRTTAHVAAEPVHVFDAVTGAALVR